MNSSKFWFASALLLVVAVGVVLGATSTTTSSSTTTTSKRPVGKRNSTTTTTTTRTTTTRKPKKSSNSTSTRVVRDTNTHGIIGSIGQDQDQRFGSVKQVNNDNNSTKNQNHTPISQAQARPVRSSLDEDQHDQGNKGNSADSPSSSSSDDSSSHVFVPSNHPLFATRTSSNVTDSLRPKLRTSPVVKSGQKQVSVGGGLDDTSSVESSSDENTDTKNHNHRRQPSPSVKVSSTSSEESVSTVVSSGPVPIGGGGVVGTGRNSSVKGFASGSINNRRPVPHKNPKDEEDEDALLFV